MSKIIRVLIVDDSLLFRKALTDNLSKSPNIEIIGAAINADDARDKILKLKPDVVTMDVEMPRVSGIDFVKSLIPRYPIPVVMVSAVNMSVFDALSAGAVDFVKKPDMKTNLDTFFAELTRKVIIASSAKVKKPIVTVSDLASNISLKPNPILKSKVIAIGASTGGTEAILSVVKDLPPHTPGIIITQHMPAGFTAMFAKRLDSICKMSVKEASDGDKVEAGRILVAPGDAHMTLIKSGGVYSVRCQTGEKVSGHCPSVDVLFNSVAKTAPRDSIGVILTGMGQDGAKGLLEMRKSGAYTIGQNKESCVVYGMPMVSFNIGAVCTEVALSDIPKTIIKQLNK